MSAEIATADIFVRAAMVSPGQEYRKCTKCRLVCARGSLQSHAARCTGEETARKCSTPKRKQTVQFATESRKHLRQFAEGFPDRPPFVLFCACTAPCTFSKEQKALEYATTHSSLTFRPEEPTLHWRLSKVTRRCGCERLEAETWN